MELRSTRSRSKTPFVRSSIERQLVESGNNVEETVVRTTRSTTIKTVTTGNDIRSTQRSIASLESSSQPVDMKNSKSEKIFRNTRYKTSDYSSDEADSEVSSTHIIDQNHKNQFIEDSSYLRRKSGLSALDFYRAAGEYWNKYPKTDYTYSTHSRDRKELAPGVYAMPNMSRKSLHEFNGSLDYLQTSNKHTNTESFLRDEIDYTSKVERNTNTVKDYAARIIPRALFSNNNYEKKYDYSLSSRATTLKNQTVLTRIVTFFTSIFIYIYSSISSLVQYVYSSNNAGLVWFGKKFHTVTSWLMLWDTWILLSSRKKRKGPALVALCLIPILLLGGLHVLLASGVHLAPPCHPHCGRIASTYFNNFADSLYDSLNYFKVRS